MITRESLRLAHEKLQFIGTVDRQYDDQFARTGAKIGSALRVRKPNAYTRRQGSRVMDVQDQSEASSTITVATQDGVDMRFNSAELALSIDDFSRRYIEPAVSVMASGIEADFLAYATKATFNVAGTAGTAITDLTAPGLARAKLNQCLAPKDKRVVQMDSITTASLVKGVATYFAPNGDIAKQYREGQIARTAMADFYENERVWTMTNGSDVTGSTDSTGLGTAGSDGSYSTIDMHTLVAVSAQNVGQVFTVTGVYACHPETKQALPYLQQFVITGSSGNFTTVSPAIYLSGARQNVCSSAGAVLTTAAFDAKTVTFVGAASTSYVQSLMYHPEAFQFVTADLPLMDDAAKCVRRTQDGLSMRVWQGSDIRNDELLMRIDILYGMAALKPEWACRLIGSATA
jgi:hypothetical protein